MDQPQEQALKVLFVGSNHLYEKLYPSSTAPAIANSTEDTVGGWVLTRPLSVNSSPSWGPRLFNFDSYSGGSGNGSAKIIENASTVDVIVFLGGELRLFIRYLPQERFMNELKDKPLIFLQSENDWSFTLKDLKEKGCKQYVHLDSEKQNVKERLGRMFLQFAGLKRDGDPLLTISKYSYSSAFFAITGAAGVAGVAIAGALGIAGVFTLTPLAIGLMAVSLIAAVLFLVLGLRNLNASESKTCQK